MNPEQHLEFIQSPPKWFFVALLTAAILIGAAGGAAGGKTAPSDFRQGLIVLGILSSLVNATLTLGVFPYVFSFLSRRLGAKSDVREVRNISAAAFVPTLTGLLLAALTSVNAFAAVGGLLSTAIFVYGLSLANGTDVPDALKHSLLVWGIIIVTIIALKFLSLAFK